eukprot:11978129-Alexandrium_andersonii.AAC.1
MTEAEQRLRDLARQQQDQGHNVRIVEPRDQCRGQPAQHDDFGAPERWSESNPCDSLPVGGGPGGGGARE